MTIKQLRIIGLLLTIFSIMFFSCEVEDTTVSVSERINLFEDDLNTRNYSSIADNFHPDMASGQQTEWDNTFADGIFADDN